MNRIINYINLKNKKLILCALSLENTGENISSWHKTKPTYPTS